jgi:lysine 2,3-aminomutase
LKGLKHFLVPLRRGTQIVYNLYDRISGLAMPQYCFNVPNGGGHVLINYNYIQNKSTNSYIITTFDGNKFEFIDEAEQDNY